MNESIIQKALYLYLFIQNLVVDLLINSRWKSV